MVVDEAGQQVAPGAVDDFVDGDDGLRVALQYFLNAVVFDDEGAAFPASLIDHGYIRYLCSEVHKFSLLCERFR